MAESRTIYSNLGHGNAYTNSTSLFFVAPAVRFKVSRILIKLGRFASALLPFAMRETDNNKFGLLRAVPNVHAFTAEIRLSVTSVSTAFVNLVFDTRDTRMAWSRVLMTAKDIHAITYAFIRAKWCRSGCSYISVMHSSRLGSS